MIRVIGLGSPWGDDRVGWEVIERLRGRLPADIDLQALDRPGAALINWLQGVDWLVLIDAVVTGEPPGRVIRIDPTALHATPRSLSGHRLHLTDTLRLAEALGCLPARIDLYGITLGSTDGPAIGPAVADGAAHLAAQLVRTLDPS